MFVTVPTCKNMNSIKFTLYSNFTTSGFYGPNQVATILGLGITILIIGIIAKLFPIKNRYILINCVNKGIKSINNEIIKIFNKYYGIN